MLVLFGLGEAKVGFVLTSRYPIWHRPSPEVKLWFRVCGETRFAVARHRLHTAAQASKKCIAGNMREPERTLQFHSTASYTTMADSSKPQAATTIAW
jgi:hypothetical protein